MERCEKAFADIGAFALNVLSSVVIIFFNKRLMGKEYFKFDFAVTLSALHFLCSAGLIQVYKSAGYMKGGGQMPLRDKLIFVAVSSLSIVSLNVSLMVNHVGFYQIAKLLVVPFVCLVEFFWLGKRYSWPMVGAILVVCGGVAIVTIESVQANSMFGLVVAALSIVGSGMQQILCNEMQERLGLKSSQMLLATAWPQGGFLLVIGPFLDHLLTTSWVQGYAYSLPVVGLIAATCFLALLVNVSQFITLGRFPAIFYQVMGHSKTILVLLGGWLLFGEPINQKKGAGMVLAVIGMMAYSYFHYMAKKPSLKQKTPPSIMEKERLLGDPKDSLAMKDTGAPLLSTDSSPSSGKGYYIKTGVQDGLEEGNLRLGRSEDVVLRSKSRV